MRNPALLLRHSCLTQVFLRIQLIVASFLALSLIENFDGAQSYLLIDAAGLTHALTRHTDRVRLAAHRYVTKRAVEEASMVPCLRVCV